MSKTIVNLTQHSILQEIEQVLELYPETPYQQAFAHPEIRQKLLVWVLNRVQNVFSILEDCEVTLAHPTHAASQQSRNEFVIRQGIQEVLSQNQHAIARHLPETESPQLSASHWFG